MEQPPVIIVVLNWNGREDTLACLDSLSRLRYPNHRVLVVDNGSADGSEGAVRAAHPDIPVLQTGSNLGFAGGNNAGIEWALEQGAEYVLLLNNDTVVEPDLVDEMVARAAGGERIGVVGAAIAYADEPDRLWAYGGGRFDIATGWVRHVQTEQPDDVLRSRGTLHFYVTGCTMLLSRALLTEVGPLETSYFHFCEDVDLCLRAEAAGFGIAVAPKARLVHKVSATTRVSSPLFLYYNLRSRLSLIRRRGPAGAPSASALAILWLRLWRPALLSGMGRSGWKALRRALDDFRDGRTGPAPDELTGVRAAGRAATTVLLAGLVGSMGLLGTVLPIVAGSSTPADAPTGTDNREAADGAEPTGTEASALEPYDSEDQFVAAVFGAPGTPPPSGLAELLYRMALDETVREMVLSRADARGRPVTSSLVELLSRSEPEARQLLPDLHVVRDDGPPPGQRPPTWADTRRQGALLLERIALDEARGRDARLLREIRSDELSTRGGFARASEVAARIASWRDWWADVGMGAEYYLDPSLRPDVDAWVRELRVPPVAGGVQVRDLIVPLLENPIGLRALVDRLDFDHDADLTAECVSIILLYQADFDSLGFERRHWNPDTGRLEGHHPAALRSVPLEILDRVSGDVASGITEDEQIEGWAGWWRRARFSARYHRDPTTAPSLEPWLGGLFVSEEEGGRPMSQFLRETYVSIGFTQLLLDELDERYHGLVAELVEWLAKDRGDAVAAGFVPAYRWKPPRPLPTEKGRMVAIPWSRVQELIREMLRRITEDEGLPEVGVDELAKNQFWVDWWQAHRRETRWYRGSSTPKPPPDFEMQRGTAG